MAPQFSANSIFESYLSALTASHPLQNQVNPTPPPTSPPAQHSPTTTKKAAGKSTTSTHKSSSTHKASATATPAPASKSNAVGIGLGVTFGLIAVGLVGAFFLRKWLMKKRVKEAKWKGAILGSPAIRGSDRGSTKSDPFAEKPLPTPAEIQQFNSVLSKDTSKRPPSTLAQSTNSRADTSNPFESRRQSNASSVPMSPTRHQSSDNVPTTYPPNPSVRSSSPSVQRSLSPPIRPAHNSASTSTGVSSSNSSRGPSVIIARPNDEPPMSPESRLEIPTFRSLSPLDFSTPMQSPRMEHTPLLAMPSPMHSPSLTPAPQEALPMPTPRPARRDPKLHAVIRAFIPTLDDELSISPGEHVRLLNSYDDGWALCENSAGEKGMVPLECLDLTGDGKAPDQDDDDQRFSKRASSLFVIPQDEH